DTAVADRVSRNGPVLQRLHHAFLDGAEESAHVDHAAHDGSDELDLRSPVGRHLGLAANGDVGRRLKFAVEGLDQHRYVRKLPGPARLLLVTVTGASL